MQRELDELLRATTDPASRPADADVIVTASRRRARRRRIGIGAAAALLVAVAGTASLQLVAQAPQGPLEITAQPGGEPPSAEDALEDWPRVTGEPVVTLVGHSAADPRWWVSVAAGEGDHWCVATSLDRPSPRFEDLCDQLPPPSQGDVFAVAGSGAMHDGRWLLWGTADRLDDDVELIVRYDDDTTGPVRHASAPELDFWLWTVAYLPELDDREPVGIDIVIDGEVTEQRAFTPASEWTRSPPTGNDSEA